MNSIFLGKPTHWLALIVIAAILWVVGENHLHVTRFNLFVCIALALALGAVSLVVFGYRPGDKVTREPLE